MRKSTSEKVTALKKLLEIEKEIVTKYFSDDYLKQCFLDRNTNSRHILDKSIQNNKHIGYTVSGIINDTLIYWNSSLGLDIEFFWEKVGEKNLAFERKDILKTVLEKGLFRDIHIHMAARYNWNDLKMHPLLKKRFSKSEINRIGEIIKKDEAKRLQLLKTCLRKRKVAFSNYLRYGDAIAYFTQGKLIEETRNKDTLLNAYFSKEEINTLEAIWEA